MADIQSNIRVNIDTNSAVASLKVLQGQISAFHQEMSRSGALAASEMSRLQNNFMNSVNRTGQFDARLKTIKSTTESFTEALEKNKMSMGQYFKYAGAATKDFGKLFGKEFDTIEKVARERVKDLQTQYIKMGRDANGAMKAIAVRPLMLDLDDLGTKTQIAAQKQQLLNQLLKQGSTNMLNWGKNTQWAGRQLMVGFTVPLTMLGQIASKTFMQMEESVIKFQRVYGDFSTTAAQTKEMTVEVTNLAKAFTKYGLAVSDTVGMAADAAAMGKQGADLLAQVESASRLAVLGGVDQKQALETTISLTNAFGIAADQLKNKINFLNVVENQTVTSIEDLTIAVPKAAPVIQQLGGNVEDLAFFLTAMKEGGINASEGANALKSGIASIINPTKKASDMLNGFGINIKGIVDANKGDVKGMVMGVADALNQLDPLKRAQAIEQLFGKFQFARISTLFKNITDVNSQASQVAALAAQGPEASAILAQRELKKIEESPMFKFKKALEDLKVELVPLGEQFLKAVTPIAKFFTDILKNFNSMSSGTKDVVGGITMVLAGLGPVILMVVGLVANGIANMIKLFAGVKSFFNSLGKGTRDLGSQTSYMTQEQIEAQAVAASLEQTHSKLTQTFTSEAGAVANLRREMEKAVAKQREFGWTPGATAGGTAGKPRKKMASGGMVRGPGGPKDDLVPTDLSNGEAVIDAETVKKNPRIISALFQGKKINIPGYANNNAKTFSLERYDAVYPGLSSLLSSTSQALGGILGDIVKLANTTHEIAGRTPGASSITGANAAHGNPRKILSVEEARAAGVGMEALGASGRTVSKLKNATKYGTEDISAFSNLTFPMPRAANLGSISGQDLSGWVKEDPKRFMSMIAKNENLDPNDPGLMEFANRVATMMEKAGSKAITESDFEKIIATGIEQQAEGAAKKALENARDTYQTFNVTDDPNKRAKREFAQKGFGIDASGQAVSGTGTSAYGRVRQGMANSGEWGAIDRQSNDFVKGVIASKVQSATTSAPTEDTAVAKAEGKKTAKKKAQAYDAGLIEEGQVQSPSRKTKEIGANYGKGFIIGAQEALNKPITSPASMQYAREQFSKMMKPFTDSNGLINMQKLNDAYKVQVRVITENEKKLRDGIQMMRVARMPQDMFWKAVDKTGQVASSVGTAIKTQTLKAFESLKTGVADLGNKITEAANKVKNGAVTLGQGIKARWNDQVDADGNVVKQGWKNQIKGNLKGVGGVMAVGSVLGAASTMGGPIGDAAGQLMGPVTAITGALTMLPGPLGWVTAGLIGMVSIIDMVNKANEKLRSEAAKLATAFSSTKDKTVKFGEATGKVSASEIADKKQQERISGMKVSDNEAGKALLESDAGKTLMADVNTMQNSGMSSKQVSQSISQQLGQGIAQGVLTYDQANQMAAAIGDKLGDQSITTDVSAQLTTIFGPDGQDLSKDPLKVMVQLQQQGAANGSALFNSATGASFNSATTDALDAAANSTNTGPSSTGSGYSGTTSSFGGVSTGRKLNIDWSSKIFNMENALAGAGGTLQGLNSIQDNINASNALYDQKINAETDFAKRQELIREKQDAASTLAAGYEDQIAEIANQRKIIEQNGKDYDVDVFQANVKASQQYTSADDETKGRMDTNMQKVSNLEDGAFKSLVQSQFGVIGDQASANLVQLNNTEGFGDAYTSTAQQLGTSTANELQQTIAGAGVGSPEQQANMYKDIAAKSTDANGILDQGKLNTYLAGLRDITDLATQAGVKIDVTSPQGQKALEQYQTTLSGIESKVKKNGGKFKLSFISEAGFSNAQAKKIWNDPNFKKMTSGQKATYVAQYKSLMTFKGTSGMTGPLKKPFEEWLKKNPTGTQDQFIAYLAGKSAANNKSSSIDSSDTSSNNNTGGSTAPTKTDKANAALSILGRKEEKINKAYDERLKALDKIQAANDKINQQKKDQLDLADALSRGDIGAAARAQQQARQNAQATALQEQRDQMNAARDAQIASLRVNGMSREQLQAFLDADANKADKKILKNWKGAKGYAIGGMVKPQYFAEGGEPRGTDTIAAMLTPGEFVVKKSAVDKIGAGNMSKINRGELPASKSGSVYNYSISVNVKSDADPEEIAKTVMAQIEKVDNQSMKGDEA